MQKNILGVDLGSSSIKIVELKKNEKGNEIDLVTYGLAKFQASNIKKNYSLEQERMAVILGKLCKEAKVTAVNAIASLPPFFVFTSIISLPEMAKEDIDSAVQWEAKKVIPLPLEQIELKWKIINIKGDKNVMREHNKFSGDMGVLKQSKNNSGEERESEDEENGANVMGEKVKEKEKYQILLTGAAKKIVQKYMYIFKKVGLNLYSLETESFALSRSLLDEKSNSVAMIVDIGALNTNISIIKFGVPFLNKSIDVGAVTISKIIANSLNINLERAEQFQYDIGVSLGKNQEKNEAIPKIIEDSLSPIINEIKYSFNLYEEYKNSILSPEDRIEKIVLSGGGAVIPNLSDYLSDLLNIKVYIGNPWGKIKHHKDLDMVLEELGHNFPVAVGLGMRDLM
ncbi:MAG: pilus assembly protein PilM [bacterium]